MALSTFNKDVENPPATTTAFVGQPRFERSENSTLDIIQHYQVIEDQIKAAKQRIQNNTITKDISQALITLLKERALFLISLKEYKLAMYDLEECISYNDSYLEVLNHIINLLHYATFPKQRPLGFYFRQRSFALLEQNNIDASLVDFFKIAHTHPSEQDLFMSYLFRYQAFFAEKIKDAAKLDSINQVINAANSAYNARKNEQPLPSGSSKEQEDTGKVNESLMQEKVFKGNQSQTSSRNTHNKILTRLQTMGSGESTAENKILLCPSLSKEIKSKKALDELLEWKGSDIHFGNAEKINDLLGKILLDIDRLSNFDALVFAGIISKLFSEDLQKDLAIKDFIRSAESLEEMYTFFCISLAAQSTKPNMSLSAMEAVLPSKSKYDAVSAHLDVIYYKAYEVREHNAILKLGTSDEKAFGKNIYRALNLHSSTAPWRVMEYNLNQMYDESVQALNSHIPAPNKMTYSKEELEKRMFDWYKDILATSANEQFKEIALHYVNGYAQGNSDPDRSSHVSGSSTLTNSLK